MGRCFVHPVFDYLLIGGGLSLVVTVVVWLFADPARPMIVDASMLPLFVLLSNSVHFASSTVRLYTKPGSFQSLPFLTMAFPLVALVLLTVCMFYAGQFGPSLQALYLTWSPYHYAAQAYGIAVIYAFRSGCRLGLRDKRILRWVCMLPFIYTVLYGLEGGVRWFIPLTEMSDNQLLKTLDRIQPAVTAVCWIIPVVFFVAMRRSKSGSLPLISMLAIVSNGVWWFVLSSLNAFAWATIFHGIQYLAIVMLFHVKDQQARPENKHGAVYHSLKFYGMSLLLGYALFQCMPYAYEMAGFGLLESVLLVTAAINIHHFIVDAFIWKLRKGDSNQRSVQAAIPIEQAVI